MAEIERSRDWKYLVMLAVTIASVVIPVWLDKYQNPDKRVIVRVLSQASLQPTGKDAFPGLQVLVDGVDLADPYLSVLQLANEGEMPVSATEFEAPLEVYVEPDRKVIRARVSETSPKDVIANISTEAQKLKLMPTLLNPRDSITVAILTTGGAPTFSSRARIIGISTVPVLGREKKKSSLTAISFFAISAFLLAVMCLAAYWRWPLFAKPGTYAMLRPRTVLAISIALQFGAVGMASFLTDILELESSWSQFGFITVFFIIAIPFARWLEAHPPGDGGEELR